MRITGGVLRGRSVAMPGGGAVRPTSARVREALFSIVGQDLTGWHVIDAFAGAGLLGLEAASRGASVVELVDRDPVVVRHLQRTVAALSSDLPPSTALRVRRRDAGRVLAEGAPVDLVLLDPPYADDPRRWLLPAAGRCRGLLVLEHRWGATLPSELGAMALHRHRRYGDTGLAVYRRADPRP